MLYGGIIVLPIFRCGAPRVSCEARDMSQIGLVTSPVSGVLTVEEQDVLCCLRGSCFDLAWQVRFYKR